MAAVGYDARRGKAALAILLFGVIIGVYQEVRRVRRLEDQMEEVEKMDKV